MPDDDNIDYMKITIATGLYPPEIGGPATYTVLLEKELPLKGHEVKVIPFSLSRKLPKVVRHLHYFFLVFKATFSSDVIYAQDVGSVGLPALLAAKLTRTNFFVRVPGDYAWEQSTQRFGVTDSIDDFQSKKYGLKVGLLKFVQAQITKRADMVITPSDYFKDIVTSWGTVKKKVHTIYNGVNLDIELTQKHKPGPLTMVTAGRLVSWKGIDRLIDAMQELSVWHLVILGDGPDMEILKEKVASMSLESRVHFLGTVTREEVFGWCVAADAFVLNTHFESFSYQIVEAMYSETPVITTNIGSIPELITSGKEGILFGPDDTNAIVEGVKSVLTEKSDWAIRTKSAKEKAETFSVQRTVDSFCDLIKDYEK